MPMFDIEDSKDVELVKNKTSEETIAKIKNVDGFKASKNEAGIKNSEEKNEDVLELKPNFFGFGLNLCALWRKVFGNKA